MSIARDAALRTMIPHVGADDIVVAVYQAAFDWMALNPRDLDYLAVGAMGQAVSHGLGLALANPARRVFVFDGDGSLLMNLGALATVAGASPANLHHLVFANRVYEVNGGHPLPNAAGLDFAGFARAAGYRESRGFDTQEGFEAALPGLFDGPGPTMTALEVHPGAAHPRDYARVHGAEARARFRAALNQPLASSFRGR